MQLNIVTTLENHSSTWSISYHEAFATILWYHKTADTLLDKHLGNINPTLTTFTAAVSFKMFYRKPSVCKVGACTTISAIIWQKAQLLKGKTVTLITEENMLRYMTCMYKYCIFPFVRSAVTVLGIVDWLLSHFQLI